MIESGYMIFDVCVYPVNPVGWYGDGYREYVSLSGGWVVTRPKTDLDVSSSRSQIRLGYVSLPSFPFEFWLCTLVLPFVLD